MNFWDLNTIHSDVRATARHDVGAATGARAAGPRRKLGRLALAAALLGLITLGTVARAGELPADIAAYAKAQHGQVAVQGAAAQRQIRARLSLEGHSWTRAFLTGQAQAAERRAVLALKADSGTRAVSVPFASGNDKPGTQRRTSI